MSVFSIPAFFIVLREVLEACLVVGIVLAYLNKTGSTQYNKWVWYGAAAGIVIAGGVGLAFGIVFWATDDQLFKGNAEKIFEGVAFLVAALLLTWMITWMMIMGKNLQAHMEAQVEKIIDSGDSFGKNKWGIFLMVFIQVLREGIETVIFLIGSANADEQGGWRAIPLPGILALIVGVAVSYLLFQGLLVLDVARFFLISSFILMAFAAGLVSHAFHELQEVDLFGPWDPSDERDWWNAKMWSTVVCCNDKTNEFFAMLRALFGYQDKPTFIEWVTYFGYWLIVAVIFTVVYWKKIRAARTTIASKTQIMAGFSLLFTFVGWIFTLIQVTWIGVLTMTISLVLSIVTNFIVYDTLATRFAGVARARRKIVLGLGVAFAVMTLFMSVLHLVELACVGTEGECQLELFFFFALIFDIDFNNEGRMDDRWTPIATLSFSLVVTFFFFGALAFLLILFAANVDSGGDYIYDDAVAVKDGMEYGDDEVLPSAEQEGVVA